MSGTEVIDGGVLAYQVSARGCCVTIAGNGDRPVLVFFEPDDLVALRSMADHFLDADDSSPEGAIDEELRTSRSEEVEVT